MSRSHTKNPGHATIALQAQQTVKTDIGADKNQTDKKGTAKTRHQTQQCAQGQKREPNDQQPTKKTRWSRQCRWTHPRLQTNRLSDTPTGSTNSLQIPSQASTKDSTASR